MSTNYIAHERLFLFCRVDRALAGRYIVTMSTALGRLDIGRRPKMTKAIWTAEHNAPFVWGIYDTSNCMVAEVDHRQLDDDPPDRSDECERIARLIAAAPETAAERDRVRAVNAELLAVLERMVAAYDADKAMGVAFGNDAAAAMARAAIAKARGE